VDGLSTADTRLQATLVVNEIFKSIQGESTWAGRPCILVRLTGCNLRCAYCDTRYAYDESARMTVGEILGRCAELSGTLVEVTGGEPLLQPECPGLVACLLEAGYTVLVETNGTMPIGRLPQAAIKILDLKCPGSGMSDRTDWTNIAALSPHDEVKFVIGDRADYEWSRGIARRYDLASRCRAVLFSAVFNLLAPADLAAWILEDRLDVRLQLQIHKYIWPSDRKGV
jgi:7-carboxy-7-deazaguanine synthase